MNPNSQNQQWSEWKFTVSHPITGPVRAFNEVQENVARFMRKGFGSAARMKLQRRRSSRGDKVVWTVRVQAESANANDPDRRSYMQQNVAEFMRVGFGAATVTRLEVKLLSGSPEDGRPSHQWLILPVIEEPPIVGNAQRLGMPLIPPTTIVGG